MSTPETKTIKTRFQLKNDTPTNWATASQNNFVPLQGEPILYKDGTSGAIYGMKVGDGTHTPDNLDFVCNNTSSGGINVGDIKGVPTILKLELSASSTTVSFPLSVNCTYIDWGDGTITDGTTYSHSYSNSGIKFIMIYGLTSVVGDAGDPWLSNGYQYLTEVTFGSTIQVIGSNAFINCTALKTIIFSNSLLTIAYSAFYGCTALKSVKLPPTLTDMYDGAFAGCTNLETVEFEGRIPPTNLMDTPSDPLFPSSTTLIAPTGTSSAYNTAFSNLANTYTFTEYSTGGGGDGGSDGCQLNTIITINVTASTGYTINFTNDGLTSWSKINWGDGTIDSNYSHTYTNYGTYVLVIEGLTSIPMYFAYRGEYIGSADSANNFITGVQFGENVTSIDGYAFEMCSNLKQITIPASVDSIGMGAFFGCNNLTRVEFESVTPLTTFYDDYLDPTFPNPDSYPNFKIIVPEESKTAYTTKLTISHQYNIVSYSTGGGGGGGGSSPTWTAVNSATVSSYNFQEGIYTFVISQTTSGYNMTSTIYADPNNMTYARGTASYNDFTGSYIGIQYDYVMDPTFSIYGGGDTIVGYFFTPCSTVI